MKSLMINFGFLIYLVHDICTKLLLWLRRQSCVYFEQFRWLVLDMRPVIYPESATVRMTSALKKMSTHPLLLLSWLLVLAFAGSLRLHLDIPIPCQLQVQIVRWGCAVPVTVRGKILPMSDTKHESNFVSLYWWRGLMSNLSKGSSFGGSGLLRRRRSISWYSASFKSRGW